MRSKFCLNAADADTMVRASLEEARKNQWNVSIAVVDDAGVLLHCVRMDGAGLATPEVATLKARTAAITGLPTKLVEDAGHKRPVLFTIPGRLGLQGGVPIKYQGQCVGAIGVSGVQSHEDEQISNAGVSALQAQINPS